MGNNILLLLSAWCMPTHVRELPLLGLLLNNTMVSIKDSQSILSLNLHAHWKLFSSSIKILDWIALHSFKRDLSISSERVKRDMVPTYVAITINSSILVWFEVYIRSRFLMWKNFNKTSFPTRIDTLETFSRW